MTAKNARTRTAAPYNLNSALNGPPAWRRLVSSILRYESDTFSASAQRLSRKQAEKIASVLVDGLKHSIDGIALADALSRKTDNRAEYCDVCGKYRHSVASARLPGQAPDDDESIGMCWFCRKDAERDRRSGGHGLWEEFSANDQMLVGTHKGRAQVATTSGVKKASPVTYDFANPGRVTRVTRHYVFVEYKGRVIRFAWRAGAYRNGRMVTIAALDEAGHPRRFRR